MYVRIKDLMEKYTLSRRMVETILKEMKELNRYPKGFIVGARRCYRIDEDAFHDYFENMTWLRHPNMRKFVKPYIETKKAANG